MQFEIFKAALIMVGKKLRRNMAGGCLLTDILIFGYVERSGVGVWAYGFGSEPPDVH